MKYSIIKTSGYGNTFDLLEKFENEVNNALNRGWQLHGNMQMFKDSSERTILVQPIIIDVGNNYEDKGAFECDFD